MSEHSDATGSDAAADDDGPSFGDAMEELDRLVAELESDALDVDQLARRVERAAELVTLCRERIEAARFSVDEVLVRLDDGSDDPVDG